MGITNFKRYTDMIKKVYTKNAPEAIGPYSQAIVCGNMLFTSGQIPINPATGDVEAEGITFLETADGAVMHVLDYNKLVGVFVHHYDVEF